MKIMAVDYGDRRTGVAFSDALGMLAGEAFTLEESDPELLARQIAGLARERGAARIVVGHPKHMNADIGERALKSADFAERLRACGQADVILWDERRTTVDAHRILSENGRRGPKRRAKVDAVAASLILQGYLDFLRLQER